MSILKKHQGTNCFSGLFVEISSIAFIFGLRRRLAGSAQVSHDYVFVACVCIISIRVSLLVAAKFSIEVLGFVNTDSRRYEYMRLLIFIM